MTQHASTNSGAPESPTRTDLTDEVLLVAAAAGDGRAFMIVYDRFAPRVLGLLMKILQNRADAEDTLQVVFTEVWRGGASFDAERGSAKTWILMLARARGIDALRARSRPSAMRGKGGDFVEALSQKVEMRDGVDPGVLARASASIPQEQMDAIDLAFYRGQSREQVAATLGIPVGTVKTRIRTGIRSLAAMLGAREKGSA